METRSGGNAGPGGRPRKLESRLRFTRTLRVLPASIRLILSMGLLMAATPALAQTAGVPAKVAASQAVPSTQNKAGILAKGMKQYLPQPPNQAVLTLKSNSQTAQPNQSVHFDLSWDRTVYRYAYHFDWGDNQTSDVNDTGADHSYGSPGTYTVNVTATPLANMKMMAAARPVAISSNAVSILVVASPQPTVTLRADKTSLNVDDTVTFTATLDPPAPDAQYRFDFGDGTVDDNAPNPREHRYSGVSQYQAVVTALTQDGTQSVTSVPVEISVRPVPQKKTARPPKLTVKLQSGTRGSNGRDVEVVAVMDRPQAKLAYGFDWGDNSALERVGRSGHGIHHYARAGRYEVLVTAELAEDYVPPVQGVVLVTIERPINWLWWVAGAVVLLVAIAVILQLRPREEKRPKRVRSQIRIAAHNDWVRHELKMGRRSRTVGAYRISPGMSGAEHDMKFPGEGNDPGEEAGNGRS